MPNRVYCSTSFSTQLQHPRIIGLYLSSPRIFSNDRSIAALASSLVASDRTIGDLGNMVPRRIVNKVRAELKAVK